MRKRYCEYADLCVSVFADMDKCLLVFVNDKGTCKVINFDSNFYSVENDIIAYIDLINDSLDNDIKETKPFIVKWLKHLKKQGIEEVNNDYLETYKYSIKEYGVF